MWRNTISSVLIVILFCSQVMAQDFQKFASLYKDQQEVKAGELNLRFESLGFFQNNEYLGNFVDGYTLPGALIRPKLTYAPTDKLYIELCGQMVKYSGKDKVQNLVTWFSARYQFTDRFSVITGNLDQNYQHGLLDQLWEPERMYTDHPESGLQFMYEDNKLKGQTWINWEQFIQQNDPYQEHFTAGMAIDYSLLQNAVLSVNLPAQILFYHKGGEIDSSDLRVQTHSNVSAGIEMALNTGAKKIKTIHLNGYWLGYKAITEDSNTYPFKDGHAFLVETNFENQHSLLSFSYWDAFQFIAPKGQYLFQSVSDSNPDFIQPERSIVSAKYRWQQDITKGARAAFQLAGYMDIPTGDFSYSYGFYLLFSQDFLLSMVKH